jgi:AmmeMemoRadiSam system protein B
VAGQFYPLKPRELRAQIELFSEKIKPAESKKDVIACMLPHAGYAYSGLVAYQVVSGIKIKNNLIILGPNHTGMGEPFSIMDEGSFSLPFGSLKINTALARKLLDKARFLNVDTRAHQSEHSIEVELPLFQYLKQDYTFVPIVIASNDFKSCRELGLGIASSVKELSMEKDTLIVASSDMTHYEDEKTAREKDREAIAAIEELDEEKLWARINELDISMCGSAAAIAMLSAAKALGAKKGGLISYQTSGDTTGDRSSVVGYAGIIIY